MRQHILIAGIGNIFMGDDAFGCEVIRALAQHSLPEEVRVVDFGIRSLDLTYAMLEGYHGVILIDAAPRGGVPGTLYVIEPQVAGEQNIMMDAHAMDPMKVLEAVAALGGRVDKILVVGCEPAPREADADWEMSLSPPVAAAVVEAVTLVKSLVKNMLGESRQAGRDVNGGMNHESVNAC